jgi:[lysine-biosynthesis-protein LysW]--L-2-aminoadipate ligase
VTELEVAVLASRVGNEEKRLLQGLDRRGVRYRHLDPRAMWCESGQAGSRWLVLNREIGHARALYAARALEASGATVVNSAAATELCGDKWLTTEALHRAGLPVPRTALALTPQAALAALDNIGYPAVIKPLVGSWGRLVSLLPDRQTAETVLAYVAALPAPQSHLVYVQELVAKPLRDLRVLVCGGAAVAAAYRVSSGWRANVALGATMTEATLTDDTARLAVAAAAAVGAELAGVDLIEGPSGAPMVLEVNHRVEFAGLQRCVGDSVDLVGLILDRVLQGAPA